MEITKNTGGDGGYIEITKTGGIGIKSLIDIVVF